jgi:integrase
LTIVPRNGRFGVKVWDRAEKRYRWLGSFDTESEASQAEADALPEPTRRSPTVERWGRIWLTDYAREAPATRQVYSQAVKSITRAIGGLRLDELDRPSARRLANAWPRNTSAVARTMWEDARRDGVCQENPWSNLRLRQSRGRKDIVALTEGEVHELADVAQAAHGTYGLEARAMILVLAYTGVRPGELCALRWGDLDAGERELHVRRSLDVTGAEKLPKNGKQRIVTVPPMALAAVSMIPRQVADDYIFHTVQGRRLSKSSLWYLWRPVRIAWTAAGHPDLDLYELRHAAATMLLERGVAHADVAVQLGHEDGGALVMARYGHPSRDSARLRLKLAFGRDA